MDPIVALEDALRWLGITDPESDDAWVAGQMLDAMSAGVRTLANRDFEGDDGDHDHDQVIRIYRQPEFLLPAVPVDPDAPITIIPLLFDGTELTELEASQWRLEDAATGRIRILATLRRAGLESDAIAAGSRFPTRYDPAPDYVRVTWSTTGAIPATVRYGILAWLKETFRSQEVPVHLAGYQTGKDAETYFPGVVGTVPPAIARAILNSWQPTNGGVI